MQKTDSSFQYLSEADMQLIRTHASTRCCETGDMVFAEGDQVDSFYIIASGRVSIYFNRQGQEEQICVLGRGEYFGEMAIFNEDKRTASVVALEPVTLLTIDKDEFVNLIQTHPVLTEKINASLAKRNEELVLRESLIATTGVGGQHLHVSIKGDPSLRESAFYRQKHESIVDQVLHQLAPQLEDLLLSRSVYRVFIGFNSGEIRTCSVFDPFAEELHSAEKLIDHAYIDRHFPKIAYTEKSAMIKSMYQFIAEGAYFNRLPPHWQNIFSRSRKSWEPIAISDIHNVIGKLTELRNIPDFYLRNFSISMIQDAIRMQFNCDGTHIVSSKDYQRFVAENLGEA